MEWLFIGALGGVSLVLWLISRFTKAATEQRSKNASNAAEIFDRTFNGDAVVSCDSGFTDLPYDVVVKGAVERGYDLYSEGPRNSYGMQKLIFKKADPGSGASSPPE